MIKDFIEVNDLGARVISFSSDSTIAHALAKAHLPESAAAALVFVDEKMDFCVVVAKLGEKVSASTASNIFGRVLREASDSEVLSLTGFERKYFPPIAVFGAKITFHNSVSKQSIFLFSLNPRDYLVILKKDILSAVKISDSFI